MSGWKDTGAQPSLLNQSVLPVAKLSPGQMAEIVAVDRTRFPMPLSEIHVKWEGLISNLVLGVIEGIPFELLLLFSL